jgi:hypothetical protein
MKFWKNNRSDREWEMPIEEIADLYMASDWPDVPMLTERKLRSFMTDPVGPISSVWEDEAEFARLLQMLIDRQRQHCQ